MTEAAWSWVGDGLAAIAEESLTTVASWGCQVVTVTVLAQGAGHGGGAAGRAVGA